MILEHKHRTGKPSTRLSFTFWVCLVGLISLGLYTVYSLRQTQTVYDHTQAVLASSGASVRSFTLPDSDKPLYLATPDLIAQGNIWGLISRSHPLPDKYTPTDLVNTSVAHGDEGLNMQVQRHIEAPLRALFAAAESEGVELMLSSAYRSVAEQQDLYDDFVTKQGAQMAKTYVATPGTSEHHTGLSIDFATASGQCESDSDDCSLSQSDAAWLAENAHQFGFIQRYPQGKQPITGVGFEPWHYRYVGVAMAREIAKSDLTLDEIIEQMAPGLKSKD